VNLLVEHYKERHLFAFAEVRATAFLEEKASAYRKELDEKDDRIRTFLERNGGFAIADLGDLVGRQRRELTSELNSVRSEIAASRRELAHLTKQRSSMSKYEAVDLQADLDKRILAAKAQLSGLEARESTVKGQMVRYDQELADIPALRKEYQNLARERDSTERLYNTYSSQLEEALVSEEMDRQKIANVTVLQAGPVPASPIRPRKLLNVSVGTVVAGMLAVLAALLMEASQPTPTEQLSLDPPGTHRVRLDADSA
jgi:uncharacterized protein involved in exopolysaccharide biosynthesis